MPSFQLGATLYAGSPAPTGLNAASSVLSDASQWVSENVVDPIDDSIINPISEAISMDLNGPSGKPPKTTEDNNMALGDAPGVLSAPVTNEYDQNGNVFGTAPTGTSGLSGTSSTIVVPSVNTSNNPTSTTTTQQQNQSSTASTQQQQSQDTSTTTSNQSNVSVNAAVTDTGSTQNTTDQALAALNDLIVQMQAGGSPQQKQQAAAAQQLIQGLQNQRASIQYDPAQVAAQQQVLQQQLTDTILPQISGAQEAAGQGQTALGAILAQNAAAQTAISQQLLAQEAQKVVQDQLNAVDQLLLAATTAPDQNIETLLQALESAKGVITEANKISTTASQTTTTEQGGTTTSQELQADTQQQGTQDNQTITIVTPPTNSTGAFGSSGNDQIDLTAQLQAIELLNQQFPNGKPNFNDENYLIGVGNYEQDIQAYNQLAQMAFG